MNQSPTSNLWHNQGIGVEILIAKNSMWISNCKSGHLRKGIVNSLDIFSAYHNWGITRDWSWIPAFMLEKRSETHTSKESVQEQPSTHFSCNQ